MPQLVHALFSQSIVSIRDGGDFSFDLVTANKEIGSVDANPSDNQGAY
jgi:hypothetical protein